MTPAPQLRRAITLTGVALAAALAGAGAAAATTEPVAPDPSTTPDTSEAPDSSADAGSFDIPGGVPPEALAEGTWFTDDGGLWAPESSSVSDEKHAAFCDFLFGTPEEIAEVFGLDSMHLVDGSGFSVMGGGGTGYRCGYGPGDATPPADDASGDPSDVTAEAASDAAGESDPTDDSDEPAADSAAAKSVPESSAAAADDDEEPVIFFTIWDQAIEVEPDDEGIAEVFVLDVGDADQTVLLAVTDEFDGEMIDAEFAEAWLTAALDRMA